MRYLWLILILPLWSFSQVTIQKTNEKWQLNVDGEPFEIKGVTFGYTDHVAMYMDRFKELKSLGVNTIRTWATGPNTALLLEAAERNDIKVLMGIWMRHGRPGMEDDDKFDYLNDKEGMEAMYNNAIDVVRRFKGHPAVLAWGIGNEVYLNTATDEEKVAYSKLLERICKDIKTMDKIHPILSVEAWTFGLDWWEKYVPSLDIYGLNIYGAGADFLQDELDKRNINKPYVITEFGVTGEWDIKNETYGVKKEPSDLEKYEAMTKGYTNWIKSKPSCLGVYIFHYGNGNKFLAPWLLTHVNGLKRPQYWAIREAYTGKKPNHNLLNFQIELPEGAFDSGTWIPVTLDVKQPADSIVEVNFYYNHRYGSRRRRDAITQLDSRGDFENGFEIKLPKVDGGIKVYAYLTYAKDNLAISSDAIKVLDEEERDRAFLLPKVELPFYVYKDGYNIPYTPSAYMGNHEAMVVDVNHDKNVYAGNSALKISYTSSQDWYGFALVDPANDWGDILGGYDISGARVFSFWAKGSYNGLKAQIGFGLIGDDKPFPDSVKVLEDFELTTQWKEYRIKVKREDLSAIRSGLVLFAAADGFAHDIYIDEVKFE
ncbi:glycoside hydrolase family 2 TIM barrel-domain containing protein [uncultured Winogradskyella sp.]|uniref:glycoside hydrolase family 2 TIM barrel-domain containing protein n=1 Tax=uncultured Winogradskyella sp. TaxID=395353 RepID=UPI003516EB6C